MLGEERLGRAGQAAWPTTTEWAHLMSICTYMLIKWVCAVHVCTLLSSCEALMRVSSKLGASISSTPSSRRLSMGKNTLEAGGREGRGGEGRGGEGGHTSHSCSNDTNSCSSLCCVAAVSSTEAIAAQCNSRSRTPPPTTIHTHTLLIYPLSVFQRLLHPP